MDEGQRRNALPRIHSFFYAPGLMRPDSCPAAPCQAPARTAVGSSLSGSLPPGVGQAPCDAVRNRIDRLALVKVRAGDGHLLALTETCRHELRGRIRRNAVDENVSSQGFHKLGKLSCGPDVKAAVVGDDDLARIPRALV